VNEDNYQNQAYEGLSLEFQPCPVGRRILAFVIDATILSTILNIFAIICILIAVLVGGISFLLLFKQKLAALSGAGVIMILLSILGAVLLAAIIWHSYFIYFEHKKGWTPGKRLLGMSVISLDGQALTYRQCLMREIFRSYCDLPLIFPGIVTMLFSKKNQRVGDMMTGTLVVYSERAENENKFLYLSRKQFEERQHKYRVGTYTLEHARSYLKTLFPIVLNPLSEEDKSALLSVFSNFVSLEDSAFIDTDEFKIRYLGEYMMQSEMARDL